MSFFNNYWKETSCSVKKIGLVLRALVIILATNAYILNDIKLGFYILLGGIILEMLLQLLPPDEPMLPNHRKVALNGSSTVFMFIVVLLMFLADACSIVKPGVNTVKTDSTSIVYKPVTYDVKGASVYKTLSVDSLIKEVLTVRDQYKADSAANAVKMAKYKQDSTADVKADKPVPLAPVLTNPRPVVQYITDPQSKARLSYWIDATGKIQLGCESKDQTIQMLQAQITDLKSQVTTKTIVVTKTPAWNWAAMAVEGALLLICAIILLIKITL